MYDAELLRKLCREISAEQDPEKTEELLSLLQAVIREDIEDIRTRMTFLRQKYATAFGESVTAD